MSFIDMYTSTSTSTSTVPTLSSIKEEPSQGESFGIDDLTLLETLHRKSKTTVPFTGKYCLKMRKRFSEELEDYKGYLSECETDEEYSELISEFVDLALSEIESDIESDIEMKRVFAKLDREFERELQREENEMWRSRDAERSASDDFDSDRLDGRSIFHMNMCM